MRVLWITAVVIVADQLSKLAVVRAMYKGQSIPVLGDWLRLTYTENPGMAFGITFGPRGMVTVFSIIATALIIAYLVSVRRGYGPYRASLALILGGALGNIIDRVFYGVLFGYDGFFTGRVVDFIHVNLWRGYVGEAVPFIGGTYVQLFPIWNVADMAIVAGVVGILIFQAKFHHQQAHASPAAPPSESGALPATPPPAASDVQPPPSDVRPAPADVHAGTPDVRRSPSDVRPEASAPPSEAPPEPVPSSSEPADEYLSDRTAEEK